MLSRQQTICFSFIIRCFSRKVSNKYSMRINEDYLDRMNATDINDDSVEDVNEFIEQNPKNFNNRIAVTLFISKSADAVIVDDELQAFRKKFLQFAEHNINIEKYSDVEFLSSNEKRVHNSVCIQYTDDNTIINDIGPTNEDLLVYATFAFNHSFRSIRNLLVFLYKFCYESEMLSFQTLRVYIPAGRNWEQANKSQVATRNIIYKSIALHDSKTIDSRYYNTIYKLCQWLYEDDAYNFQTYIDNFYKHTDTGAELMYKLSDRYYFKETEINPEFQKFVKDKKLLLPSYEDIHDVFPDVSVVVNTIPMSKVVNGMITDVGKCELSSKTDYKLFTKDGGIGFNQRDCYAMTPKLYKNSTEDDKYALMIPYRMYVPDASVNNPWYQCVLFIKFDGTFEDDGYLLDNIVGEFIGTHKFPKISNE